MQHLTKSILLSLQKYYHLLGIAYFHRLPLLWGIMVLLITCCGMVYIKKIIHQTTSLRETISTMKNESFSTQKSSTALCSEFSEKDILKKLEFAASKYHLTIHSIVQKAAAFTTVVWTISGEYAHLLNWLSLIANHSENVDVNHFHLWREKKSEEKKLFLLIEMVFYENSTCNEKS